MMNILNINWLLGLVCCCYSCCPCMTAVQLLIFFWLHLHNRVNSKKKNNKGEKSQDLSSLTLFFLFLASLQ
ncbi:MAG: hypothetical protein JOS17DRAFT_732598 [Linnemannia elongata]|nr:MAG: hypothetical protein JOS17DRAFT_732598 [Linnemannia elongata]